MGRERGVKRPNMLRQSVLIATLRITWASRNHVKTKLLRLEISSVDRELACLQTGGAHPLFQEQGGRGTKTKNFKVILGCGYEKSHLKQQHGIRNNQLLHIHRKDVRRL